MLKSKRPGNSRQSQTSQKPKNPGESQYFKEVVSNVGITLQYSGTPNVYTREALIIQRDMQRLLEQHENHPNNIPEFINGLKHIYFESKKEKYLRNALMPSMLYENEDMSAVPRQQDSFIRVLLGIDCLQEQVISLLLQAAVKHVVEEGQDTMWLTLILRSLRYLSYISEPHALSDKLLELLEVGTKSAQREILTFIPEIIPDSEYEDTGRRLVRALDENPTLTSAIVDCLGYLGLGTEMKEEIQDRLLAIMSMATTLDNFPMILSFLVTDCRPANLVSILTRTRSAIHGVMASGRGGQEADTYQVLTFHQLRELTCGSVHNVAEGWIQLLTSIHTPEDHLPVDILILLMLHSFNRTRKHIIEKLIKKKIKTRQLKPDLVEETLNKYLAPQIFNDYLKSVVSIASSLLSAEAVCVEMARVLYTGAFTHRHANAPSRQEILSSLIMWPGGRANAALSIMLSLEPLLLKPHSVQLMGLLDKLDRVGLVEAGQIFQLLSGHLWAQSDEDSTPNALQNDMNMIVRKQLASGKQLVRYRGVLAAVATVRQMARRTPTSQAEESMLSDTSYSSVSDLPAGPIKQAATLLELATESTRGRPQAQGLYYDQLARMLVTTQHLDQRFLSWLVDSATDDFQSTYVVNSVPDAAQDVSFAVQYTLNESDAVEDVIIINIGELSMKGSEMEISKMITLAPLFRLVRVLHQKFYGGSLQSVNAILGCGVALPEVDPDIGLDNFATEDSKRIMDSTFHCINWFRELISAFVTQKDPNILRKVLTRITNLIQLEETMKQYIKQLPDHKLPASHFYNANVNTTVATAQEGPKPKRRKPNANSTTRLNTTGTSQTQAVNKTARKIREKDAPKFNYRELDTDIITLLKYPLSFEEQPTEELSLTLDQFVFVMKDLVHKLQTLLKPPTSGLSHLDSVKLEDLINDCVKLMPYIDGHLTHVINEMRKLVEKCDGIHDAQEMFQPHAINLKTSLSLLLEAIASVLSWPGFHASARLPLLRDCLRALVPDDRSSQILSAKKLAVTFIKRLLSISEHCFALQGAVSLVNIVKVLNSITISQSDDRRNLSLLSGKLLERKWYTLNGLPESGAIASLHINDLVQAHLNGCDVNAINSVVSWVHAEASQLKAKDDHLTTFQCINKATFSILYRGICSALLEALRLAINAGITNTQHLDMWHDAATTLHGLMDIVKMQENRPNLNTFLKKSTGILKLFLSHGLPIFEITLRSKSERVFEILKIMQQTTRFVHNLCCHSKVTKDSGLVAHVPQMRLTLETLVYRVKALLAANNCSAAFWMGNLKNKNLAGEEISSQATGTTTQASDDEEQPLPADDSDQSDSDSSAPNDSASEIF